MTTREHGLTDTGTVARLRATFDTGRTRDLAWRRAQLEAVVRLLDEGRDELVAALQADLQRTALDAALLDIASTRTEAQYALRQLRKWAAPRRVRTTAATFPGRAWYQFEPVGVVLVISPWNYPIHLALAPVAAALAAGNCVVVKPSEATPACSQALADLLPRYVDPDAVAVVQGAEEATQELLAQAPDHCFFTGSPAVGRAVMKAAAEHLTPVTLELGGKSPAVVMPSADLTVAAKRIAFGKLTNSGQTCVAPDYVLVHEQVRDTFTAEVTRHLREFSEGAVVPLLDQRSTDRLRRLLDRSGGLVQGDAATDQDRAMHPTVVLDPDPTSDLMSEEIFGPVLPVVTVDSLQDAIAHVRRGTRPLASYLFTADADDELRFLEQVVTGGAVVNHVLLHLAVPELPFGGVGTSGHGRYHGRWGFETFSNPKAVLRMRTWWDPSFLYPPHRGWKKWVMERAL